MTKEFSFTAPVWLWTSDKAPAAWHFVSLDQKTSDSITKIESTKPKKRGRGSVKVEVRIGFVTWQTSLFPSKERGLYILPLKAAVRKELQISDGDEVLVYLKLI